LLAGASLKNWLVSVSKASYQQSRKRIVCGVSSDIAKLPWKPRHYPVNGFLGQSLTERKTAFICGQLRRLPPGLGFPEMV
jgi:hypothetical protein